MTVLRVAQAHIDREIKKQAIGIVALENHDPAWLPPAGARWAARAELDTLALEPPRRERRSRPGWPRSDGAIPARGTGLGAAGLAGAGDGLASDATGPHGRP